MFEKKFGFLRIYFIAMSVLAIVAVITSFVLMRLGMKSKSSEKMVISASFYPEYVIAVNLLEGTEVGVSNLTANVTGCVHDYQLTTADMKNIEESIAVVINGGHMDHFAADAVEKASGGLVLDAGTSSSGEGAIKDSYINMYLSNLNIIAGSVK